MSKQEFEKLLADHRDFFFAYALKRCGHKADAQDLYQDAVARAYRFRDRFQPGTNFRAWMATIITRTHLSSIRRRNKRKPVSEPVETFLFALENKQAVANTGEQKLLMEEYEQVVSELGDKYRIPFLLFIRGYEYQEIAEIMQLPIGTVKSRLHTARKKLQGMIQAVF